MNTLKNKLIILSLSTIISILLCSCSTAPKKVVNGFTLKEDFVQEWTPRITWHESVNSLTLKAGNYKKVSYDRWGYFFASDKIYFNFSDGRELQTAFSLIYLKKDLSQVFIHLEPLSQESTMDDRFYRHLPVDGNLDEEQSFYKTWSAVHGRQEKKHYDRIKANLGELDRTLLFRIELN